MPFCAKIYARLRTVWAIALAAVAGALLCACASSGLPVADPAVVTRSKPTRAAAFSLSQRKLLEIIAEQNRLYESAKDTSTMGKSNTLSIKRRIEALWAEYLAETPDDVEAIIIHGKFLRSVGSYADSYSSFRMANDLDFSLGVVKQQLATYEAENGLWREAYDHMKEALALEPDNPVYLLQTAKLILVYRQIMMTDGGFEQAALDAEMLECYRLAANFQPQSYQAQLDYALAFYDVGSADWSAALAQWDKVISMSGINVEKQTAQANKARVLIELNRDAEAENLLKLITLPALNADKAALLEIINAAKGTTADGQENGVVPKKKLYSY